LGYRAAQAELTLAEIDQRLLPCLFLPQDGPAIVLLSLDHGGFEVFDTAAGRMRLAGGAQIRGSAHFFTRAPEGAPTQPGWRHQVLLRLRPLVGQAMLSAIVYG